MTLTPVFRRVVTSPYWLACCIHRNNALRAKEVHPMPKFVIERAIHGVGSMSPEQIQAISQKSCSVLRDLGPQIQWLQSFVTDHKIYCVYIAPNEEMVREHARLGGFPVSSISQVRRVLDPTSAEA
jgi:hypothetical protein